MVGEFLILIAIVILGGALIKILADMRIRIDHQTKVDEEILEALVTIRGDVRSMAHPAKNLSLETDVSRIKDLVGDLQSAVRMVETAVQIGPRT